MFVKFWLFFLPNINSLFDVFKFTNYNVPYLVFKAVLYYIVHVFVNILVYRAFSFSVEVTKFSTLFNSLFGVDGL
jgi:uncharacterized YccA/Bax inhibitor family protein